MYSAHIEAAKCGLAGVALSIFCLLLAMATRQHFYITAAFFAFGYTAICAVAVLVLSLLDRR